MANGGAEVMLSVGIFTFILAVKATANSITTNCSCGYYDATAATLWTESIIVYFNETDYTPIPDFIEESYSHKYEKGWNTRFRTGADISNVNFTNSTSPKNSTSLELKVSPYTSDHLVVGSSVRTSRRDIQYGSFISLLRSPGKSAGGGGSVLSFAVEYNSSQSISTNLQNTNVPSTAYVSTLANEESPDTNIIDYSSLTNGSFGNDILSPWDFTEYRLEWTKDEVKFFIGDIVARSISRSQKEDLLSVPSSLYLRHWSNGLAIGSQGPPNQSTVANVGYARFFFNSSLMTDGDHASFDSRCRTSAACSVADLALRGSSVCLEKSTEKWKQLPTDRPRKKAAIWLSVASISMTALLLLNPILKRVRERLNPVQEIEMTPQARKESMSLTHSTPESPTELPVDVPTPVRTESSIDSSIPSGSKSPTKTAETHTPFRPSSKIENVESSRTFRRRSTFHVDRPSGKDESRGESDSEPTQKHSDGHISWKSDSEPKQKHFKKHVSWISVGWGENADQSRPTSSTNIGKIPEAKSRGESDGEPSPEHSNKHMSWNSLGRGENADQSRPTSSIVLGEIPEEAALEIPQAKSEPTLNITDASLNLPEAQKRIDHLAGLVVVSCLLVTAVNFILTFISGDHIPGGFAHYRGEALSRKTTAPFLESPIWIGPFLLTSARFLVTDYLRTGHLQVVAEKATKRSFRLILPIIVMVMLEYFFIDCNATK
ncbi:hypothetical protein IMSHALPRED_007393 [Imshaugia aleurites]|uniref:GH16 domain-containing protein n=1 Tax=Imshaugia aleurites TaxID=172621 RepID=A0A8H3FP27_9LECA|nr:hypothetical protein IMSHALPRED_007393 [Imshaugia aleurites]